MPPPPRGRTLETRAARPLLLRVGAAAASNTGQCYCQYGVPDATALSFDDDDSNDDGESMCEGHGYDMVACASVGCCQWDVDGATYSCWSSVGTASCYGDDKSSGTSMTPTLSPYSSYRRKLLATPVPTPTLSPYSSRWPTADDADDAFYTTLNCYLGAPSSCSAGEYLDVEARGHRSRARREGVRRARIDRRVTRG